MGSGLVRCLWIAGFLAAFACTGCERADPPRDVLSELQSPEWRVRHKAVQAINRAMESPRATGNVVFDREAAFNQMSDRLSSEPDDVIFQDMLGAMLLIDPERARQRVLNGGMVRIEFQRLMTVLCSLNYARQTLPEDLILPLAEELRQAELDNPNVDGFTSLYAAALPLLARSAPAQAEPLIREALVSKHSAWKIGAAEAMQVAAGIENPLGAATKDLVAHRYDDSVLSPEHLTYLMVDEANADINFDGFMNALADDPARGTILRGRWDQVPEAMERVGAPEAAALVREALKVVPGADASSADADQYHAFSALDERYRPLHADVVVALSRYVVNHRELFGGASDASSHARASQPASVPSGTHE